MARNYFSKEELPKRKRKGYRVSSEKSNFNIKLERNEIVKIRNIKPGAYIFGKQT